MDNKEEQVDDLHIIKLIIRPSLNQVSLSSLRGKHVLLMFYPVDFGYVTPTEFYTLAPFLPLLTEFNCDVLAISTEHISSQKNSQAAPRSKAGLDGMRVRLASDPVGKVSRLYGVYKAEENLAFSGFFLVDPEGTIVAMEKSDFPVGRSMEEQARIVAKVVDREDELITSMTFASTTPTRGTRNTPHLPSSRVSKNDGRPVTSPTTPVAVPKQKSSKASSVSSSNKSNTSFSSKDDIASPIK